MSNVLPLEEKKNIARARRARAIAVAAFLIFYAGTIASVALFPSYILLRVKENNVTTELAIIRKEDFTKESESLAVVVRDINAKLRVLSHEETPGVTESVLMPLLLETRKGIIVTSLTLQKKETGADIALEGEALTRSDLLAFVDTLKTDTRFSGVELPIANLVKDKNILFSLTFSSTH